MSFDPLFFTVQIIKSTFHWIMLSTWLELFSLHSCNKAGVPFSSLAVSRQYMSCFNILFLTKFHSCRDWNMRKTKCNYNQYNVVHYLKFWINWEYTHICDSMQVSVWQFRTRIINWILLKSDPNFHLACASSCKISHSVLYNVQMYTHMYSKLRFSYIISWPDFHQIHGIQTAPQYPQWSDQGYPYSLFLASLLQMQWSHHPPEL